MKPSSLIPNYFVTCAIVLAVFFGVIIFCANSINVQMDSGYLKNKYIIPDHFIYTDRGMIHVAQEYVVVLSRGDKTKGFIVKESIYNAAELDALIVP